MARSWFPRRERSTAPPSSHEVTLVTRAGCHLCDEAAATLATMAGELGFPLVTLDVDDDPGQLARYADLVPVVLVDGRQHGYWRVEPDRLRTALGASRVDARATPVTGFTNL